MTIARMAVAEWRTIAIGGSRFPVVSVPFRIRRAGVRTLKWVMAVGDDSQLLQDPHHLEAEFAISDPGHRHCGHNQNVGIQLNSSSLLDVQLYACGRDA